MTAGASAINCRGHRSCASGILPSWTTINYRARVIAQGMRPAIERQVRQELAAARGGRKPMRTQWSSRPLSIQELQAFGAGWDAVRPNGAQAG